MQFSLETASQIRSQRYLAYNTTSNLHSKKLLKLLDNLRNDSTSNYTSENNPPDQIDTAFNRENNVDTNNTHSPSTTNESKLVTDLTRNLNTQEINLLSKGHKFRLSSEISEHTITSINITFYGPANQIR